MVDLFSCLLTLRYFVLNAWARQRIPYCNQCGYFEVDSFGPFCEKIEFFCSEGWAGSAYSPVIFSILRYLLLSHLVRNKCLASDGCVEVEKLGINKDVVLMLSVDDA